MINLAYKDIRHSLSKFVIIAISVGILLGIVIIMLGVYRGMVYDAKVFLGDIDADIWIVQEGTLGPFAESSRVHQDLREQISYQKGIKDAQSLTFQNFQLMNGDKDFKVMLVGYDITQSIEVINPSKIIKGRKIQKQHFEIVVSKQLGYDIGDTITLGRDQYEVVGITQDSVSNSGDYLIFTSLQDAQMLQFTYTNERIRSDERRGISGTNPLLVNAIVASVKFGYDIDAISQEIAKSTYTKTFTTAQQENLLLQKVIKQSSKQIGMFTVILIVVSIVIIGLIIYTMTIEKIKEISIMKLIGIPNTTISGMILQETLVLSLLAYLSGNIFAHSIAEKFPKRVLLEFFDSIMLFVIIVLFSALASLFGIYKVIKTDPAQAIGG